jgi:uncharacterized protein (TIGR03435 family)
MNTLLKLSCFVLWSLTAFGQTSPKPLAFEIASVKASPRLVGADYNNQFTFSSAGASGRNVTLKRLIAEAYHVQMNQVLGPNWLDQNEYDIDAKSEGSADRNQLALMLHSLLLERFNLKEHTETRRMSVYQLVTDKGGPKIQPTKDGEAPKAGAGFHFHGDLRQLADLIAVQLTIPDKESDPARPSTAAGTPIPVLDKTGLSGTYDFSVDIKPELGTNAFAVWQRVLREQLGLRIESGKGDVTVIVIDNAMQIPTAN